MLYSHFHSLFSWNEGNIVDSNLCAPLFHCYSMNEEELKALSFSISYWSNEELETRIDSFLASVFKSLDNEATRKRALLIIQQLNERLSKYSVGKEDLSCRIDSPSSAKIDHSSHELVHFDSPIQFFCSVSAFASFSCRLLDKCILTIQRNEVLECISSFLGIMREGRFPLQPVITLCSCDL